MSAEEKKVVVLIVEQFAGEDLEYSFETTIKYDDNDKSVEEKEKLKIKEEIMQRTSVYQVYFEDK